MHLRSTHYPPRFKRLSACTAKARLQKLSPTCISAFSGAWNPAEPETYAAFFGFGSQPDFHGRQFYLNSDAKSVDLRNQYTAYIARLYQLAGEPESQAKGDAAIVLEMETSMAKAAIHTTWITR
jgi:predicted metalloendopeptidase